MVKKIAYYIYIAVVALFLVWVAVSWLEVATRSCSAAPAYSGLNFFGLFFRGCVV
jgi:hypothetical protein